MDQKATLPKDISDPLQGYFPYHEYTHQELTVINAVDERLGLKCLGSTTTVHHRFLVELIEKRIGRKIDEKYATLIREVSGMDKVMPRASNPTLLLAWKIPDEVWLVVDDFIATNANIVPRNIFSDGIPLKSLASWRVTPVNDGEWFARWCNMMINSMMDVPSTPSKYWRTIYEFESYNGVARPEVQEIINLKYLPSGTAKISISRRYQILNLLHRTDPIKIVSWKMRAKLPEELSTSSDDDDDDFE